MIGSFCANWLVSMSRQRTRQLLEWATLWKCNLSFHPSCWKFVIHSGSNQCGTQRYADGLAAISTRDATGTPYLSEMLRALGECMVQSWTRVSLQSLQAICFDWEDVHLHLEVAHDFPTTQKHAETGKVREANLTNRVALEACGDI